MRRVAVLVLVLAACEKKAPPPQDHCPEDAIERVGTVHWEMIRPKAEEDELAARMSKLQDALMAKCHANKWPADVARCLKDILNPSDANACWADLPADQRADLDATLEHYEHRGAQ